MNYHKKKKIELMYWKSTKKGKEALNTIHKFKNE